jgi:hypothetical protein
MALLGLFGTIPVHQVHPFDQVLGTEDVVAVDLVFGEVHRVAQVHLEGAIGMGLSPVKIMEGARNPAERAVTSGTIRATPACRS